MLKKLEKLEIVEGEMLWPKAARRHEPKEFFLDEPRHWIYSIKLHTRE